MNVRLLTIEGCPNVEAAAGLLERELAGAGVDGGFERIIVRSEADARRFRFLGSPSVQIDDLDIEQERRVDPSTMGARTYGASADPLPGPAMIREAIDRARSPRQSVLFLCTGNSCRSQMGEGLARALKGDLIEAHSAGIETHGLNPLAVRAMSEMDIDISSHRSKHVNELSGISFDYVFTVCDHAHESCPVFPGATRVVHRSFDDPPKLARDAGSDEEALVHYRRVRDEIRDVVMQMPGILQALATGFEPNLKAL